MEAVTAFCRFAVKYQGNTRAYEKHTLVVVSVLTQAGSVKWPKRPKHYFRTIGDHRLLSHSHTKAPLFTLIVQNQQF